MTRRLLYLVTEDWYFCSHRLPLAIAARSAGYEVSVATRVTDHGPAIREAGLELIPLRLSRGSQNPLRELASIAQITALYRRTKPHLVHHVAVKPVLYGSIAARVAGVPSVVNALAGLGYLFSSRDLKARMLRPFVQTAYRALLNRPNACLILQNPDDLSLLQAHGIADPTRTVMIRGSGVDLAKFASTPEPPGVPLVVLPARLLRDKGIVEFVDAARRLRDQGAMARFALVGEPDPGNPASVPRELLTQWVAEGVVEWWGWREDMAAVLRDCHVVCLPSYREGLPKALIEAAAAARPIVTCDVPGCREVVSEGDNGLLVPARDSQSLAEALGRLLADPDLRRRMGARGRARAEAEFSLDSVIERTLALYRSCVEP